MIVDRGEPEAARRRAACGTRATLWPRRRRARRGSWAASAVCWSAPAAPDCPNRPGSCCCPERPRLAGRFLLLIAATKKKENGSQDYHGGLQSTSTIPWKPEPRKMAGRNNEGRTWAALLRQTDAVADVVEGGEVDGPADVLDGPFGIGRRQNLVLARRRLVGRQHADLAPRHLLLVDHHLRDRVHRFDSSFSVRLSVFFGMAKFFYAFQQLIYAS